MNVEEEQTTYTVVINHEEQYSIWPTFKIIPPGWNEVGRRGTKEECLSFIKEVWTDMRPLSLRSKMAQRQALWEEEKNQQIRAESKNRPLSATVAFLIQGNHRVTTQPTDKTYEEVKESLKRGFLHLTFTDTQGGTCLGIKIDAEKTLFTNTTLHIEGILSLDFVPLRCIADISILSLEGTGHLKTIQDKL